MPEWLSKSLMVLSKRDKIFGIVVGVWLIGATAAVLALPPAEGLGYKARILFFHIPMAWIAVLAFLMGAWWSVKCLRTKKLEQYYYSASSNYTGLVFCLLATVSGAIYARLTWGAFWNWDVRQTTIFILLLIYVAYIVLGYAIEDEEKRARISAVYSLFSFVTVPFLVFIIPRLNWSLHPNLLNSEGAETGVPNFSMDANMGMVLTGTLVGITALYIWILRFAASWRRAGAVQDEAGYDEAGYDGAGYDQRDQKGQKEGDDQE